MKDTVFSEKQNDTPGLKIDNNSLQTSFRDVEFAFTMTKE